MIQGIASPGSSDRLNFEGCQTDVTPYPIWVQNFESAIHFSKCTFVGNGNSYCYVNDPGTGKDLVTFDSCNFDNFDGRLMHTKANTTFKSCNFTRWGKAGSLSDAIYNDVAGKVTIIDSCKFNGSGSTNARGVNNNDVDNYFIIKDTTFENMPVESYRITTGKVVDKDNIFVNSSNPRTQVSFIGEIHSYKGTSAPTSGNYKRGDIIENTSPSAGNVAGWICTESGSPGIWFPLAQVGHKTVGSSPVGNVIPFFRGEEILDTTNKKWYKSTGLTSADWVALN